MKLGPFLLDLAWQLAPPHVVIGESDDPYLLRWHVVPRNPLLNVYLHHFCRSDDDRALHDHPWWNLSILLRGRYLEHTIDAGGIHRRVLRRAGRQSGLKLRAARAAHRIEIIDGVRPWTLFITGPRLRVWGFHCPEAGWVRWQDFTTPDGRGVGAGCDARAGVDV